MPPLSRVALLVVALSLLAALGGLGSTADSAQGRSEAVASDPPIVVVWGQYERAHGSATGDLYVVQADARRAHLVRRWGPYGRDGKPYGAFDASWSPDRSSIGLSLGVFFSDPGSQAAVIDPAGRSLRSLTGSWTRRFETWTQDGTEVIHGAFWRGGPFHIVPASGGRSKPLRVAGSRNYRLHDYEWSWKANRIAAALEDRGLVTMDLDGRDLVQITRGTDVQPKWSPDGKTIVFTRFRQNGRGDIYTMDANGHHLRQLGSASGGLAMDWSPDGRKILFVRGAHVPGTLEKESSELWVMNADGTARARLAFNRAGWDVLSADWGS